MVDVSDERDDLLTELETLAALETLEGAPEERAGAAGDPAYTAARGDFARVAALLAVAAAPVEPPPSVKERLLARIAEAEAAEKALPEGGFWVKPGVTAVRTSEAAWQATLVPGLAAKVIHRDEERKQTMRLLRIEPGARYPWHRHGDAEEIFMLTGTLWVNGVLLKPGDYCRSEPGTDETGTYSDEGATAIVISSDKDEVSFDGPPTR